MRHLVMTFVCVSSLLLAVGGCRKSTPPVEPKEPEAVAGGQDIVEPAADNPESESVDHSAGGGELAPIPLTLPKANYRGTPPSIEGVDKLEKPLGKPRPAFYAPVGTRNLALNKPVTGTEEVPVMGSFDMIVDGDKEAGSGGLVDLGPFEQWIQIDLEKSHEIYAIVMWHFHSEPRAYFDVVVQVSDDPDFVMDVTTVYNNDHDNSLGLGVGTDAHYVETAEGRLIDTKGVKARYVRLYSQGSSYSPDNHYVEVEVYGQ